MQPLNLRIVFALMRNITPLAIIIDGCLLYQ